MTGLAVKSKGMPKYVGILNIEEIFFV